MSYKIIGPDGALDVVQKKNEDRPVVYLGGNNRGRDWRVDFLHRFENEKVFFINPRREVYARPDEMPNEHAAQVLWERTALECSDIMVFWLGEGLANQAARVEIGFSLGAGKRVIIGAEPGFLGLEHLSAFSGLVLSSSVQGLMDRLEAVLREERAVKSTEGA